jgi:hypothetical protein
VIVTSGSLRKASLLPLALLGLALAVPAFAHDGDTVSRTVKCTKSSSARLDLRREDGSGGHSGGVALRSSDHTIAVTFTVRSRRSGVTWRVVLLHERRIVFRGRLRTRPPKGMFVLHRSLPDWYGSEVVAARATSPKGEVCPVSVRL